LLQDYKIQPKSGGSDIEVALCVMANRMGKINITAKDKLDGNNQGRGASIRLV